MLAKRYKEVVSHIQFLSVYLRLLVESCKGTTNMSLSGLAPNWLKKIPGRLKRFAISQCVSSHTNLNFLPTALKPKRCVTKQYIRSHTC